MIFQLPYCPAISMASWKILIKSLQIDMYSTGMALAHCMPLQEKHGKDKNAALEHDFKTLADVLIQVHGPPYTISQWHWLHWAFPDFLFWMCMPRTSLQSLNPFVQETVRHDLGRDYPSLAANIRGEESSSFTNTLGETLRIRVCEDRQKTAKLLEQARLLTWIMNEKLLTF